MEKSTLNYWFEGNGPNHFYKYRFINEYTKDIIVNNRMFFSSAGDFNDPFEFLPLFTMEASKEELRRYHQKQFLELPRSERRSRAARTMLDPSYAKNQNEALRVATKAVTEIRPTTGLLCLSARPDQMLLWSHYADSHRGIALRFKPSMGDKYFEASCPVLYQKERPILNLVKHSRIELLKQGLLTKADFWSYEEEWRIVLGPDSKGTHAFHSRSLDGIILGAKISTDDERVVRDWVATSGLTVNWFKAKINDREFRLDILSC